MKVSNFGKRIVVLVFASMLFGGSLLADNMDIINSGMLEFHQLNKHIDTSKYGELSKYKIGEVTLEEFVQVRNSENKAQEFINHQIDNVQKLNLNQNQKDATEKLNNEIESRIKKVNSQKLKNSTTFGSILVDNAKGAYDAIKAAPTLAKYEAKFLVPGASKAFEKMKITYKKIDKVMYQAAGGIEILNFGDALIKSIEPFFKKGFTKMDVTDASAILDSMASMKESLVKMKMSDESGLFSSGKAASAFYGLIKAIDDGLIERKILNNVDNLQNDGLLSERGAYLLKAKVDNDMYGNLYDSIVKAVDVAKVIGFSSQLTNKIAEYTDDFKTIRDVFTNAEDRILETAFTDVYDSRIERKNSFVIIAGRMESAYERIEHYELAEDPNKAKLATLKATDAKLKSTVQLIKEKKEQLSNIQQGISNANARRKNAERGSDEYNYAVSDWKSLVHQKHSILNEINKLTNSINSYQTMINNLQTDIKSQMSQFDDTVDDFNNDNKKEIGSDLYSDTNEPPKIGRGSRTWYGYASDTALDSNNVAKPGNSSVPVYGKTKISFTNGKITHIKTSANDGAIYTKESSSVSGTENHIQGQFNITDGETTWKSYGSYSYTYWGQWESPNATPTYDVKKAYWIVGQTATDIPTQGSANYNGIVKGFEFDNTGKYVDDLTGTTNINVNFANGAVGGNMNINKVSNGGNFANVTINGSMNAGGTMTQAQLSGSNVASWSKLSTQAYGPGAQEIGGFWWVNKSDDGHLGQGIISAKKQ